MIQTKQCVTTPGVTTQLREQTQSQSNGTNIKKCTRCYGTIMRANSKPKQWYNIKKCTRCYDTIIRANSMPKQWYNIKKRTMCYGTIMRANSKPKQ